MDPFALCFSPSTVETASVFSNHGKQPATRTTLLPGASRLWRRPSGVERIFCAIHDQRGGCGRVVFISRFSGPQDSSAIERALRIVSERCKRAWMRIEQSTPRDYEFRIPEMPDFPPIEFISVADADHGCSVAVERGREGFPPGQEPVLRWLVLLSEADETFQIVGLTNHGLFDAFSIALLMRRFLEVLGSDTTPNWDWPEPKIPRGKWSTIGKHYAGVIQSAWKYFRRAQASRCLPRDLDSPGACLVQRWSPEETADLSRVCRSAGTTVTAALGLAGILAVQAVYGRTKPFVGLVIPVNLRRYLPAPVAEQTIGAAVTIKSFAFDCRRPIDFVDQSRRLAAELRDYVNNQSPLRVYHSVNMIVPRRFRLADKEPTCVSANSLGRFDAPPSSTGVRLLECVWFGNGGSHMPAFSQTAATVDDRLTVASYSTWIAPDRLRALAADVDQRLREFAGLAPTAAVPSSEELATSLT